MIADPSKISDFEIAMLTLELNACYHKIQLISELLTKIGEAKGITDTEQQEPKSPPNQLPGTDFDKLPWKSYQTKQPAKPDEAAWIFSNAQGAEALLSTLKSKDGKAKIGNFEYQLQGTERQFIARKPVK
jgi:hypothetical protein